MCSKCEFRHAAPTGKACTAGVGVQELERPVEDDKKLQRGQGPNLVGLDAHIFNKDTTQNKTMKTGESFTACLYVFVVYSFIWKVV